MPKYYRFRATTPTRKPKRCKEKGDNELAERSKQEVGSWPDMTLACTPAPLWYLRRVSWRESPPLMGLTRQLAAVLGSSLQLSNRAMFVFKFQPHDHQQVRVCQLADSN